MALGLTADSIRVTALIDQGPQIMVLVRLWDQGLPLQEGGPVLGLGANLPQCGGVFAGLPEAGAFLAGNEGNTAFFDDHNVGFSERGSMIQQQNPGDYEPDSPEKQ